MTPAILKVLVRETEPHFFDKDAMEFFGDTMRNYGVRPCSLEIGGGKTVWAWELFRKKPVKHGFQESVYFSQATYERVFPAEEGAARGRPPSLLRGEKK